MYLGREKTWRSLGVVAEASSPSDFVFPGRVPLPILGQMRHRNNKKKCVSQSVHGNNSVYNVKNATEENPCQKAKTLVGFIHRGGCFCCLLLFLFIPRECYIGESRLIFTIFFVPCKCDVKLVALVICLCLFFIYLFIHLFYN